MVLSLLLIEIKRRKLSMDLWNRLTSVVFKLWKLRFIGPVYLNIKQGIKKCFVFSNVKSCEISTVAMRTVRYREHRRLGHLRGPSHFHEEKAVRCPSLRVLVWAEILLGQSDLAVSIINERDWIKRRMDSYPCKNATCSSVSISFAEQANRVTLPLGRTY